MTEKSRYWSPSETYELVLKVGDLDLTQDLISVNIITSVELPYQSVIFQLSYDPNSVVLEKFYGQKPITFTINLLATNRTPLESITFNLMYLDSNMEVQTQTALPQNVQKDRRQITVTTIPRNAYQTMTSYVNEVFLGKTINDVVQTIVKNTGAKLVFDAADRNQNVIDQIVLPPATLYDTLKYINQVWGFFKGAPGFYCSYENKLFIKNLTSKMRMAEKFIIYQLATSEDNRKIIEKCNDGKRFYTLSEISTDFKSNAIMSYISKQLSFITKPKDRLFSNLNFEISNFIKKYGIVSGKEQVYFDKNALKSSKSNYFHHTGYELDETFAISDLAKQVAPITTVTADLSGSLKILKLMEVGEAVQIISKVADHAEIFGKYVLVSSEIQFERIKGWTSKATVQMIRSTRSIF